ncbi:PROTEIN TRICHOME BIREFRINGENCE-LIKE 9-RELATED [Salix purpurea]|uniref:PROTEIN TRICHOME BIREFRINGENCE-LIKE 9-RELATED n=1 Tax=Salix purpurea TaxID=77065 RepID=A0A9Q0Q4F6_SALPP|nr:PROTEIN TRICHOME BIREFRINGENCE-LIKE 9-RELATED [Salix purpurea]
MANSSSFNHRHTVITSLFLFSFLLTIFLFNKRALEPTLYFYRDFFPQATTASHISLPDFTLPDSEEPFDSVTHQPISQNETIESKTGDDSRNMGVSTENENDPDGGVDSGEDLSYNSTNVEVASENEKDPGGDLGSGEDLSYNSTNVEVSSENEKEEGGSLESGGDLSGNGGDKLMESLESCDLYKGTWVKDEEYPIYKAGSCPYVDEAFDCQGNGRKDSDYLKWRWKPNDCDLPRFNGTDFLTRLRGKRLMLVGDSMNRNQFESMLCLLREGLPDKSKMFEIHGRRITKGRGYYVFKFVDYKCSVEFVRSHFLVKEGVRINAQGSSNPTLSIDVIDKTAGRWKRADILVFNTGHWWTHGKTARGKNYYKEGDYLYPKFDAVEAYRRALRTWGKWIDKNVNPKKQLVFYRGYSSAHFRGGDWDSGGTCNGETEPVLSGSILNNYPVKMKIVEEVIREMKNPVTLLNVTSLTNFRKDGHPSIYGKNVTAGVKVSTRRQDCSHWCVPGVPDAWNELIYATLVQHRVSKN